MARPRKGVRTPSADTAATLREREHALRNELFGLKLRTDLAWEEVARRRADLNRRLAHAQEMLARSRELVSRARERHHAT